MRRNADLDFVVRNPIISAINIVLTTKKSSKFGILLCATGLFLSFCCYLKLKRKQKKITAFQDKIKLQSPLNKNLLILLDESWRDGKYDNFTYLLPQYKQYGKMAVFKNVFLYLQMDQNMQIGDLNFSVNSNNLDQIIRKKVQRTDLSQTLTPKLTFFVSDNIHIDFIRKSDMISSAFLKDFNENQIYSGLISELRKYPKQKLLIFEYISQKILGTNTLFDGNQISWQYPNPFSVSKGNQLCMKCTAIIHNDEIRVTNIKAIANDFVRLKYFLEANIISKIRILQTKINLTKISMAVFGFFTIYQIGKYIINQLEPYMLKKEYPGLDQIKQKFSVAYCDQGTRCIHCKSRPASFIFIPCYHLQCCKQCFDEHNQIECKTCKITIYCGIPVFVCK
ncbi:unnamed protein product [Paramecium primaurelia]|uniref:RING-type domain-containing protein n=1 Tax=Paramecium primaurelia TaxID=5886 RepID=A0A8S1L7K7_PARPR|nr:unnamed protein product [Paramecium primaurelia]